MEPFAEIQQNAQLRQLFQATDDPNIANRPVVGKGSVITFAYTGQAGRAIHDPYPLVIVSGIYDKLLTGINCHYLTLPYIKSLVTANANNKNFSYANIRGDAYIVGAFRSYKRSGISQLKALNAGFLRSLLSVVRALDPGEIDQMREQIHQLLAEQYRQMNQPIAEPGPEQIPNQ